MRCTGLCVCGVLTALTAAESTSAAEPLAGASFEFMPRSSLADPPAQLSDYRVQVSTLKIFANAPLSVDDQPGTAVIAGIKYDVTFVGQNGQRVDGTPQRFHQIGLSLRALQRLGQTWSLLVSLDPALATDFDDLDTDQLRISGAAVINRRFTPTFSLGLGALFNYMFGELLPLPVVALRWRPAAAIKVDMFLPVYLQALYALARRVELGIRAEVDGNRFSVRGTDSADNIKYSLVKGGLLLNLRLFDGLWLTTLGGASVARRFQAFDRSDAKVADLDLDPAFVVRAGIEFRPGSRACCQRNRD